MMRTSSLLSALLVSSFSLLPLGSNASTKVLDIKHWQTKNGVKVLFVEAPQVPMLDIKVVFSAGSAFDGPHWGLAALTNETLAQGANGLDAQQLAEKFDDVGAQFSRGTTKTSASLNLRTLTLPTQLKQALTTFSWVLSKPNITQKAVNREKAQQQQAILAQQQSPQSIASNAFYQALYPAHPYGHPIVGISKTVAALTTSDVKRFYKKNYAASNAILTMTGAISLAKAKTIAETLSQDLPITNQPIKFHRARPLTKSSKQHINYPSSQTVIQMGQLGINHQSPLYYPLIVGNYTLGGGSLVSRLSNEVREKRGLTYGVYSYFSPMPELGPFLISLATKGDQSQRALKVTQDTLEKFITQGPSETELNAAKKYLNGSFPLRLSSNRQIVNTLSSIGFYQLPLTYLDDYLEKVNAVSVEEIQHAFQTKLHPKRMITVTVGGKQTHKKVIKG